MEEEMSTTATTTNFLPQEIVMDILSRLPAKSLVSSFKLVCKPWRTLIQDPAFVKMHLSREDGEGRISSNNNHSLICKSGNKFFQFYPPFNFEGLPPIDESAKKLDLDLDLSMSTSILVGSCNGLLCLSFDADQNIILLNPSTRKYKLPPKQPIKYPKDFFARGSATYGFGCCYNSTTNIDEYKVVRIVYFYAFDRHGEYSSRSEVNIYSMSSNSWETKFIDRPYKSYNQLQSGVSVNEALHWMVGCTASSWDTIDSFDIRDEEFRQVPIPLSCHPTADEPYFKMHGVVLMNMKGCLSMIRFSDGTHGRRNIMDAADLEIWIMKEYGIKESWTKEFVIRSWDTDPPRALSDCALSWTSNAYVLKGDQILIEVNLTKISSRSSPDGFRKLFLCDINKGKINGDFKMIGVRDESYPRVDRVDFIETLVSLKSSIMVHALDSNLSSSSS